MKAKERKKERKRKRERYRIIWREKKNIYCLILAIMKTENFSCLPSRARYRNINGCVCVWIVQSKTERIVLVGKRHKWSNKRNVFGGLRFFTIQMWIVGPKKHTHIEKDKPYGEPRRRRNIEVELVESETVATRYQVVSWNIIMIISAHTHKSCFNGFSVLNEPTMNERPNTQFGL